MSAKLLRECTKYLSSEGIYYTHNNTKVLACINGKFVVFEFEETPASRKIEASGGILYHPRSLRDFIERVRTIQSN